MAETILQHWIFSRFALPFLLVFFIIFALLEKTKILGTEEIEGTTYTRKNLNAMIAFVVSFLVVASSKLVEIIADVSSQMVVLLLASVFFLLLVVIVIILVIRAM